MRAGERIDMNECAMDLCANIWDDQMRYVTQLRPAPAPKALASQTSDSHQFLMTWQHDYRFVL